MAQRTPRGSSEERQDRNYEYRGGPGREQYRSAPERSPQRAREAYPRDRQPYRPSAGNGSSRQDVRRPAQPRPEGRRPSGPGAPGSVRSRSAEDVRQRPAYTRKKKKRKGPVVLTVILLFVLVGAVVFVLASGVLKKPEPEVVQEDTRPLPAAPKVVSKATIGSTGDIILHVPILDAHATGDGEYDFSYVFSNVAPVYEQPDLMFANLEVTLGGPESGEYTGYPGFNSPDAIVPALKNAGVDVCLTANNHANDTGYYGMMRTLDVLDEYGMEHLGSRKTVDEPYLMVKDLGGIRLGMLCYTYDTREYTEGEKSLNFNYLSDEGVEKIATFNYNNLDEFYADVQKQLDNMDMLNVDASVIFIHWGAEYQDDPNAQQQEIAQHLCEMGVDVIIGGHPHVIQQFDTLISSSGHETICLYSMGNELSNQRAEIMDEDGNRGYTEDGLVMQVAFEKLNNGKVRISGVDITPTWVELDNTGYQIIGLKADTDPYSWGAGNTDAAIASYNRTLGRVGDGYIRFREEKHQEEIPTYME